MSTADTLLDVRGLRVDIPTPKGMLHAVRGIDFDLKRGETLCLVGESGCGKSLTAMALMGLLPRKALRTADRLEFQGNDILSLPEKAFNRLRGNRMAMIFQEPMTSLNPALTIGQQLVDVHRQHRNVSTKEARERALFLFEKIGVSAPVERLKQYPHELSGGLRQRMMIAMALMCGPQLLLADEPTTALDVTIQAELLRVLRNLQEEFGMGMILITHDLGVVSRMADKVAVMYAGEIVERGDVYQVFNRPSHPYTRGLLECLPIPGRHKHMAHLPSIPGVVPSLIGDLTGCAFRERCQYAEDRCGEADIDWRQLPDGQGYRCILPTGSQGIASEVLR